MNEQLGILGTTRVEFESSELCIVGGDYGQIILAGTTEEARRTVDALVAAARYGSGSVVDGLNVLIHDAKTPFIEARHAGFEGTTRIEQRDAAGGTASAESSAERGSSEGPTDGGP